MIVFYNPMVVSSYSLVVMHVPKAEFFN